MGRRGRRRMRALRLPAVALACGLLAGLAGAASAQVAPPPAGASFLFINQERILVDSGAGRALLAAEEEKRKALVAEARAIDSAFEDEERQLTEKRGTIPTREFRELADAFDERVVAARKRQDERSDALAKELDQARRQFYSAVAPVLVRLMERHQAQAIFDENSVLLADQRLNITDEVIAEIDAGGAPGLPVPGAQDGTPQGNENNEDEEP